MDLSPVGKVVGVLNLTTLLYLVQKLKSMELHLTSIYLHGMNRDNFTFTYTNLVSFEVIKIF
jgi:hypothetical protein